MSEGQAPGFTLKVLGGFQLLRAGVSVKVPARKLACLLTLSGPHRARGLEDAAELMEAPRHAA